jgi:DNA-binding transcriptional regulator YiaG
MTPQARQQANAKTSAMLLEMPLHELRRARGLSQKVLAEALNVQ